MNRAMDSKFFTCRYWAIGPRCPNIDNKGIEVCEFAHRDTGRLASSSQQRGTCAMWMQQRCPNGSNCIYEHRHTGVTGLYQGVVSLYGINLEIADAAQASGFNTFNHEALMNLIWSVKRVVLKNNASNGRHPPPKDPIYPDRYRPSGVGDNTKRKRHIPARSSLPRFCTIRSLGSNHSGGKNRGKNKNQKKRDTDTGRRLTVNTDALDRVLGNARVTKPMTNKPGNHKFDKNHGGTPANPINLLDDSEDEDQKVSTAANTSAKRQKTTTTSTGRYKADKPYASLLDTPTNQIEATSLLDLTPTDQPDTTLEITQVLTAVQETLVTAQKMLIDGQLTMKALFNRNTTRLSEEGIFPIMMNLSKEIYRAHDSARDGVGEIVRSIEWFKDNTESVKDEIS